MRKRFIGIFKERGWDNFRPSDIAKSIMIEGAELLELFQWENLSLNEIRNNKGKIREIEKELADVLIYAMEMSVLLNLDTEKIIHSKLAHVSKKYPAKLMKASKGQEPGTQSEYLRIKKEYRTQGL